MKDIKIRYTYKRKEDGKIYQQIAPIECIEGRGDKPLALDKNNPYWDIIARDLFTGLSDKNNTEIYEGDIIVAHEIAHDFNKPEYLKYEVVWAFNGWFYKNIKTSFDKFMEDDVNTYEESQTRLNGEEFVVIGNIYENGDLLK